MTECDAVVTQDDSVTHQNRNMVLNLCASGTDQARISHGSGVLNVLNQV
jgi:hypothetical protein